MSAIGMVTGNDCLKWVKKDIGLTWRNDGAMRSQISTMCKRTFRDGSFTAYRSGYGFMPSLECFKVPHDNSRIIGYVKEKSDDGGFHVVILGSQNFDIRNNWLKSAERKYDIITQMEYEQDLIPLSPTLNDWIPQSDDFETWIYPARRFWHLDMYCGFSYSVNDENSTIPFDDILNADMMPLNTGYQLQLGGSFKYRGYTSLVSSIQLTNDPDTTLEFGADIYETDLGIYIDQDVCDNPLYGMFGSLDMFGRKLSQEFFAQFNRNYDNLEFAEEIPFNFRICITNNGVCVPFNLMLTDSLQYAKAYINNGTLPPDAYLFPLDWEDLPKYDPDEDNPDDDDDGGDPDDDGNNDRDIDDTPLNIPSVTPQMLDANNVYWLGVGEYGQFLTWFWYDIQNFSIIDPTTWDNLLDNLQGLYNNLAETIVSVRFMPIKPAWVGGLADAGSHIKLGMIEDYTNHSIFNKYSFLEPREIGHIKIPKTFDTYLDLSPYSQLSLYLPFYGFVDLDVDMFTGHDLYVKAIYDILSGTIVYYIYYDNTALINYYMAKLSVDVPITLQSAYDRDRTIQQNLTESIVNGGSFMASLVGGNPIGMTLSAGSLVSSPSASAPLITRGYGAEQGILFTPSKCAIYLRRPVTTKKGRSYAKTVGNLWCKTYTLSKLSGFTICQNPHITFRGNTYVTEEGETTDKKLLPLAEEIEEIYDYLTKGVIL